MDYLNQFNDYCDKLLESKKVSKPVGMADNEWETKRVGEVNITKKIIEVSMTKQIMRIRKEAEQKGIAIIYKDFQMVKELKLKEFININFYQSTK